MYILFIPHVMPRVRFFYLFPLVMYFFFIFVYKMNIEKRKHPLGMYFGVIEIIASRFLYLS